MCIFKNSNYLKFITRYSRNVVEVMVKFLGLMMMMFVKVYLFYTVLSNSISILFYEREIISYRSSIKIMYK